MKWAKKTQEDGSKRLRSHIKNTWCGSRLSLQREALCICVYGSTLQLRHQETASCHPVIWKTVWRVLQIREISDNKAWPKRPRSSVSVPDINTANKRVSHDLRPCLTSVFLSVCLICLLLDYPPPSTPPPPMFYPWVQTSPLSAPEVSLMKAVDNQVWISTH